MTHAHYFSALTVIGLAVLLFAAPAGGQSMDLDVDGDAAVSGTLTVGGGIVAGSGEHVLTNAAGLINGAKVQSGTIASTQLGTSSVSATQIAVGAVTSAKIADGTITGADVQDGSLTGADIQDLSIGTADLEHFAVTTAKINNAAIIPTKLDTTATYQVGKVGVNTDVPRSGVGSAKLALHGTHSTLDAPIIQATGTQDDYPILTIIPWAHNSAAIRFDAYLATNEGGGVHRSSWSSTNAQILKLSDKLSLGYQHGVAQGAAFSSWDTGFSMNCTDGSISMLQVYEDQVGGTNRQLYIDDTGKLGYLGSSIEIKENVRPVAEQDTAFIYNLRPVMFDYKDHALGTNRCGLIAEEVATVCPRVVSYKREITYEPVDPNDAGGTPDAIVTTTDIPETVNYNELIVPMLAEMQRLQNRVQELETRLAALENK